MSGCAQWATRQVAGTWHNAARRPGVVPNHWGTGGLAIRHAPVGRPGLTRTEAKPPWSRHGGRLRFRARQHRAGPLLWARSARSCISRAAPRCGGERLRGSPPARAQLPPARPPPAESPNDRALRWRRPPMHLAGAGLALRCASVVRVCCSLGGTETRRSNARSESPVSRGRRCPMIHPPRAKR